MPLAQNARLGPYEIVSPLGAGGMGEVYKARDTRLDRTVAIKVLPQHLSSSPEVRQRFEREAKTISQLSHPHICALYDVGNQDGVEYLVMEYLEGETLAERLVKGPLPTDQTLRHGIEIAKTCLAKDPEDRWQTARDVVLELRWIAEGSQTGIVLPAIAARRSRERVAWILAALFGIGLALTLPLSLLRRPRGSGEGRALKLSVLPPEKAAFVPGMIALSPDGSRLAFVAGGAEGKNLLWVRPLDSLEARPLPGTEGAYAPFWSPDSRFLAFFAEGKLKKIEASGGPPQLLYTLMSLVGRGGTWNREGVILFAPSPVGPLFRTPDAGGAATPVTRLDDARQENSHRWPVFLPDGRHFLYFARSRQKENRAIFVGSLDSKEIRFLMNGTSNVLFAPASAGGSEGHLLFEREGWLVARKLDLRTLRFEGDPIPIAEKIQASNPLTAAMFTVSETGALAYGKGTSVGLPSLAWFDRSGKRLGSIDSPGHCLDINFSPDQKRVALDVVNFEVGGRETWQVDLTRGVPSRLTAGDRDTSSPVWSPDGSRIAFASNPTGMGGVGGDLYQKLSSGVGNEEQLFHSDASKVPADWSADGRFLLFESRDPGSKTKLWVLPLSGDRKPFPLLRTPFSESLGAFSPDGRWIAYVSDESGRPEVYVQTFPVSTAKWRVSTSGGTQPRWRRDGKEIFYLAPDSRLMALAVTPGSSFEVGVPTALFEIGSAPGVGLRHRYGVTSDGERFLVVPGTETQETSPITVVLNWTAGLTK